MSPVPTALPPAKYKHRTSGSATEIGPGTAGSGNVLQVLQEWNRVLKRDTGTLLISVPDLSVLADQFANNNKLSPAEKFHLMRMIFGGQTDSKDSHLAGFDEDILVGFLVESGFCRIRRVDGFGGSVDWEDTSSMVWHGKKISLNVIAQKCY